MEESLDDKVEAEEPTVEDMKQKIVRYYVDHPDSNPTSDELRARVCPAAHNYELARRSFTDKGILKKDEDELTFDPDEAKKYL